jgi:predicted cupin superfamily sugar epimerase
MTAKDYIQHLQLITHPEGGYYKETYRSPLQITVKGFDDERSISTSIYFLLEKGQESALHRIKSDEIWFYQDGDSIEIFELDDHNTEIITCLGKNITQGEVLQHVVKAGRWFGSRLKPESSFCLVACQVSPGFDFRDFELFHPEGKY